MAAVTPLTVVGLAPAGALDTRGRSFSRRATAAARPDGRRVVSLSPAPVARAADAGTVACSRHSSRPRFSAAPAASASLRVYAKNGVFDPAEEGQEKGIYNSAMRVPNTMAKIGRQLGGGGAATLEKQGLDLSQRQEESSAKTDDTGGGGNNGGKVNNGGGGGDGDEGDDDDYYDEGDDEEGDDGYFATRNAIQETYDREAIKAVLAEWYKTLADLPTGIRMAVEMGIVSSMSLVRFMSMDVRPSVIRTVSRNTPLWASRAFVGRLMAEPAFLWKLGFEQAVTIGTATMYEVSHRGENLKKEWDLALSNIVQLSVANALVVWCMCPSRSYGAAEKFAWQRVMSSLPNNAFDRAGPLRQYTNATRAASVLAKAAELSAIGVVTGGLFHGVNSALVGLRKGNDPDWQPSVKVPDLATSALGMGAFLGLSCNLRYQLIGGADRWCTDRLTSLASAVTSTALVRLGNTTIGDQTRLFMLGMPIHAPVPATAAAGGAAAAGLAGMISYMDPNAKKAAPKKKKKKSKKAKAKTAEAAAPEPAMA